MRVFEVIYDTPDAEPLDPVYEPVMSAEERAEVRREWLEGLERAG